MFWEARQIVRYLWVFVSRCVKIDFSNHVKSVGEELCKSAEGGESICIKMFRDGLRRGYIIYQCVLELDNELMKEGFFFVSIFCHW